MKTAQIILTTGTVWIGAFGEACAESTTRVYSSGAFVLGFIAFCAVVVVIQMIPAIVTLWGMVKGISESSRKEVNATVKE